MKKIGLILIGSVLVLLVQAQRALPSENTERFKREFQGIRKSEHFPERKRPERKEMRRKGQTIRQEMENRQREARQQREALRANTNNRQITESQEKNPTFPAKFRSPVKDSRWVSNIIAQNSDDQNQQKEVYTYNAEGLRTASILYQWSDNGWEKSSKEEYNYDENGALYAIASYNWYNEEWQGYYKQERKEDSCGKLLVSAGYIWDNEAKEWVGNDYDRKGEAEYNDLQGLISYTDFEWNPDTKAWIKNRKTEYSGFYEVSNFWTPAITTEYTWDREIGDWKGYTKHETISNETTIKVSYVWDDNANNWIGEWKYEQGEYFEAEYNWDKTKNDWFETYRDESNNQRDLVFFYDWDETLATWIGIYKNEYTYNKYGEPASEIFYDWDTDTNDWRKIKEFSQEYDRYGNETFRFSYKRDDNDEWVIDKDKTEDATQGDIQVYIYYQYSDNQWIKSSKHEYLNENNSVVFIHYQWDISNSEWRFYNRHVFFYNTEDYKISDTQYLNENNTWTAHRKEEYGYDDKNQQNLFVSYVWDTQSNDWKGEEKREYKDEQNNLGYKPFLLNYSWNDDTKTWQKESLDETIQYHSYNYGTESYFSLSYSEWNEADGVWMEGSKEEYEYSHNYSFYYYSHYHSVSYEWDPETRNWIGQSKDESDENQNYHRSTSYTWDAGKNDWAGESKYETQYDCRQNQILSIWYTSWDWDTEGYWTGGEDSDKYESQYDDQGNQLLEVHSIWDRDTNDWFIEHKYEAQYDDYGRIISRIESERNENGELVAQQWIKPVYNNDLLSRIIHYQYYNPTDVDYTEIYNYSVVWTGEAGDKQWDTPANWSSNLVPDHTRDVVIPGNVPSYPVLEEPTTVNEILFEPGAQIGNQHHLLGKAFVQYDFSSEDSRGRWHMLSVPLQEAYPGDFTFGGHPNSWVRKFVVKYGAGNTTQVEWETARANLIPFTAGDGCILWLNSDDQHKDIGLPLAGGILELPFFDNPSVPAAVHHAHDYNHGPKESKFYNFALHETTGRHVRTNENYSVDRTEAAYKLSEEAFSKTLKFGEDDIDARATVTLIGNPYLAALNFDELYGKNKTVIKDNYRIWTGKGENAGFAGYHTEGVFGVINHDLTQHIAPLQAFIVEQAEQTEQDIDSTLIFNISMAGVNPETTLHSSSESRNKLDIVARNTVGGVSTFIARREGGQERFGNLDARKIINNINKIPEVYTLKPYNEGLVATGANITGNDEQLIPLGLATTYTGSITLTFNGMQTYDANIRLIDAAENREIDLTGLSTYTYSVDYVPPTQDGKVVACEDRFYIRILKNPTGWPETLASDPVRVYTSKGAIRIIAGASGTIKQVSVYNLQGSLIYTDRAVNAVSHSMNKDWPAGAYLVQVVTEKSSKNFKLVIQ